MVGVTRRRRGEARRPSRRTLLALLVACALVGQAVGAAAVPPVSEPKPVAESADSFSSAAGADPASLNRNGPTAGVRSLDAPATDTDAGNATTVSDTSGTVVGNVTLVTGHRVRVVERNGSIRYRTRPDADLRKVVTSEGTYVYPTGIDFRRFDRRLFDVDLLRRQNLTDRERETIPVIVSTAAEESDPTRPSGSPPVREVSGLTDDESLASIDAVAAAVRKPAAGAAFEELAANDRVERVALDVEYEISLDEVTDATGVGEARAAHGASGRNVTVAVVDSGIDGDHPDLGNVVAERDFTGEGARTSAPDPVGHGTHVAGIVAGDGTASGGQYVGVAPNASLLDARAVGSDGRASTSDVVRAINWSVESGADVVSISIGGPVTRGRSVDPYRAAIDHALARGTVVVVAAGNDGPDAATVRSPGVASGAITVGATDKNGQLAYFSSRGPTPIGFRVKPDLVAPGVSVVSAASADAGYDAEYVSSSGTSMATPVVSGIAALLLDERPSLAPRTVKSLLVSTADPIPNRTVYERGAGVVNASRALDPSVVVSPGVTDVGAHATNRTVTRAVTVRNLAARDRTVALDAALTPVDATGEETAATAALNRSTLALAPGERATVALTVETGDAVGVYSGRITVTNATAESGATASTAGIFGLARTHRLTVSKHALGSGTASGDAVTVIADDDAPAADVQTLALTDGTATVTALERVGYTVVSSGTDEETGRPVVTVARAGKNDTAVHLRESETVAARLNASLLPAVEPLRTNVNYRVSTPRFTYVGEVEARGPLSPDALVSPSENLSVTVERLLGSRDGAGDGGESGSGDGSGSGDDSDAGSGNATGFDRAALYDVVSSLSGVTTETTHTVRPSELGELNVTYRRTGTGRPYDLTLVTDTGGPREVQFDHAYRGLLGDRTGQTVYVSSAVERVGLHLRSNATGGDPDGSDGDDPGGWAYGPATPNRPVPASGDRVAVVKNVHPLRSDLDLAIDEEADSLTATSAGQRSPVGDAADSNRVGGDSLADARPGRLLLAVNGTTRANATVRERGHGNETVRTDLSPNASVAVTASDASDAFALSGETVARYRFRYRPDAATAYRPANVSVGTVRSRWTNGTDGATESATLGIDNGVPPGRATAELVVDRDRSAVESVTIAYAHAGGGETVPSDPFGESGVASAWSEATVSVASESADETRYAGSFELSAEGTVALAVRVETTAGSVTERVARPAFRVSGVAPLSATTGRPTDVDGDGSYEDTDGDGAVTRRDAALLFERYRTPNVLDAAKYYDLNGDGSADVLDAQRLLANSTSETECC
ncbi:S8 family serine peptidase [Halorussus salinus]|uniref:S8 family serine peptidase n=1 Tax=Halorussus salinus TaxID=1364935 RepID=UPI0010922FDB|nr:S8 family serine peptidase [Halorussus salinus]